MKKVYVVLAGDLKVGCYPTRQEADEFIRLWTGWAPSTGHYWIREEIR